MSWNLKERAPGQLHLHWPSVPSRAVHGDLQLWEQATDRPEITHPPGTEKQQGQEGRSNTHSWPQISLSFSPRQVNPNQCILSLTKPRGDCGSAGFTCWSGAHTWLLRFVMKASSPATHRGSGSYPRILHSACPVTL